jgi:PPOX class probable F420-dependent enzyme
VPPDRLRIGDGVSIERLHDDRNVWLVTVRPDGRPHVAPVWFVYVDDRIWIGTGAESVRVRNLRRNPVASACLEDGDAPVIADGSAFVHESERPAAVVAAFMAKYGWDVTADTDADVGRVVLLEFRPERWLLGLDLPVESEPRQA